MSLSVLKLGWEFPPNNFGGLGVACEGLVRGLTQNNIRILMILPRNHEGIIENCKFIISEDENLLKTIKIDSLLKPYSTSQSYVTQYQDTKKDNRYNLYGECLFAEVSRYAHVVLQVVKSERFDIIHAHDWMTIKAGILAKQYTGKPLILHIHATELDRTGGNGINQMVYEIEREGMHYADKIIAVSEFTKQKIIYNYGIDASRITVVHNAISQCHVLPAKTSFLSKKNQLILFLGRVTLQKGPDYFITVAEQILKYKPNVIFIIVGDGDMRSKLINRAAAANLGDKILFTGHLQGVDIDKAYQAADVFVMPSVSEPFGLTALEAIKNGTPAIISKQSGVSEVVTHCLKVDFWDIDEMVNKIISVLDYKELCKELAINGAHEVSKFSWDIVAQKCIKLYNSVLYHA